MSRTRLKIAVGINDRTLPLLAGLVAIEGVEPDFVTAPFEEIFARAFDEEAFDVTELSNAHMCRCTAVEC